MFLIQWSISVVFWSVLFTKFSVSIDSINVMSRDCITHDNDVMSRDCVTHDNDVMSRDCVTHDNDVTLFQ